MQWHLWSVWELHLHNIHILIRHSKQQNLLLVQFNGKKVPSDTPLPADFSIKHTTA